MRIATVAMASLILTGCVSTPKEPSIVHRTDAEAKEEPPGESIVLRAGESATIRPDATAIVRGQAQREAIVPRDPAARAKLEADRTAQAEEEQAKTDALAAETREKRIGWLQNPASQPYLQWLCAFTPGTAKYNEEIFAAAGKYGIVPKRNPSADAEAERAGYATFDCSEIAGSGTTE